MAQRGESQDGAALLPPFSSSSSEGDTCGLCAPDEPRAAAWRCFTCLRSFCEPHARLSHGGVDGEPGPAFRGHRLRPVGITEEEEDLEALRDLERLCADHVGRPVELFCVECGCCVCALCPAVGAHQGHGVQLLAQAAQSKREIMASCLKQLVLKQQQEKDNTKHIEEATNALKAQALASRTWLMGKFTELRLLFDEEEALTKRYIDEKVQQTLRAYEEQSEACKGQVETINSFVDRIRQIQLQPDPLLLLKEYSMIEKDMLKQRIPAEQLAPVPVSFEHITNHFKRFLETIQSIFQKPLKARLREDVFSSLDSTLKKEPGTLLKVNSCIDRSLFLKHARTPTLEMNSLHPRLTLSEDRLSVSYCWRRKFYPSNPQRFDKLWQVLSRDSFSAGSHYWEVDLFQAEQGWWIGAAYPSIKRKGDSELCRLGCNRASWCIKRFELEYWAFHDGERIPIRTQNDPYRVGVFLDYEAGVLSFYNVTDGMAHLHTFHAKFTEPIYPAVRVWEGTITIYKIT
ncbi:tripartite motif-containing protein 14 [Anolis carolinensis]|uniref:Tripartite motif containing 14 n=1 Tax=Anolis carolinensis TaxID=28377 RepID=H9G5Y3_ANOCA|nr:PREDICTED: tripartite motif-containing protein 14 [Anolis carolinensis]|eukprot:XP_008112832.1 PREDICTED: tripartite motif-containing protein 14 [Anolis carolinensis]